MNRLRVNLALISHRALRWSIFENDSAADEMLEDIVNRLHPGRKDLRILEIGTCQGVSACILAQFGRVTTLDIKQHDNPQIVIDALGMGAQIVRLQGTPEIVRPMVNPAAFDLAFIDGSHDYASVLADFEWCKPCGSVILHDYCARHQGTMRAINSLRSTVAGHWDDKRTFAWWRELKHG